MLVSTEPGIMKENRDKRHLKLRIYGSFEEAAHSEAIDAANKPPLVGLKETVDLILRAYGVTQESLKKRRKKLHINIIAPK